MAPFDLMLAGLALHLQTIRNLFTEKEAALLEDAVMQFMESGGYGQYALDELRQYRAVLAADHGSDPRDAHAALAQRSLLR